MSLLAHSFDLINSLPTDIPDPGPVAPPGFAGPVAVIMGWVKWVGLIVAVLGVIIIGAKLAINVRRGEADRPLEARRRDRSRIRDGKWDRAEQVERVGDKRHAVNLSGLTERWC